MNALIRGHGHMLSQCREVQRSVRASSVSRVARGLRWQLGLRQLPP